MPLAELNLIEVEVLHLLNWHVSVRPAAYRAFLEALCHPTLHSDLCDCKASRMTSLIQSHGLNSLRFSSASYACCAAAQIECGKVAAVVCSTPLLLVSLDTFSPLNEEMCDIIDESSKTVVSETLDWLAVLS